MKKLIPAIPTIAIVFGILLTVIIAIVLVVLSIGDPLNIALIVSVAFLIIASLIVTQMRKIRKS